MILFLQKQTFSLNILYNYAMGKVLFRIGLCGVLISILSCSRREREIVFRENPSALFFNSLSEGEILSWTWTLSSPSAGSASSDNTPIFSVVGASTEGQYIQIYSDNLCAIREGGLQKIVGGATSHEDIHFSNNGSEDGTINAYAVIYDDQDTAASNCVNLALSYSFDTRSPSRVVITTPENRASTDAVSVNYVGICEGDLPVRISGDVVSSPVQKSCVSGVLNTNITLLSGDGVKSLTFRQTDLAGNLSLASTYQIVLDESAADEGSIQSWSWALFDIVNGSVSKDFSPAISLSGAAEGNGSTVKFYVGSSCTAQLGGQYTIRGGGLDAYDLILFSDGSNDGFQDFHVQVTNVFGVESVCIDIDLQYTLDATVPIAPTLTSHITNTYVQSYNLSVSGGCEVGNEVTIRGDVTPSPTTFICSTGGYSGESLTLSSGEGQKSLYLSQKDAVDNVSGIAFYKVVVDSIDPTVTINNNLSWINIANSSSVALSGSCSEEGRDVSIHSNGLSQTFLTLCLLGQWQVGLDLTGAVDGSQVFTVDHEDIAGNTAAQRSLTLIKDTAIPSAADIQSWTWGIDPANGSNSNDYTVLLSMTSIGGEDGDVVKIYNAANCSGTERDSQAIASNSITSDITFASDGSDDGLQSFYVQIGDAVENASTCVDIQRSFTLDTLMPDNPTVIDVPEWTQSTSSIVDITWNASTSADISHYEVAVGTTAGGTDIQSWVTQTSPATISGLSLTECTVTYHVTLKTVDTVGNETLSASYPVKVDATVPGNPTNIVISGNGGVFHTNTATWVGSTDNCGDMHYEFSAERVGSGIQDLSNFNVGLQTTYKAENSIDRASFRLFPDSVYQTVVEAVDAAGNRSARLVSNSWQFSCINPFGTYTFLLNLIAVNENILDDAGRDANNSNFSGFVSTWVDGSGNNRDLRPWNNDYLSVDMSRAPAYVERADIASHSVESDGVDDRLSYDINPDLTTDFTFIYVFTSEDASPDPYDSYFSSSSAAGLDGGWQIDAGGGSCPGSFRLIIAGSETICGSSHDTNQHSILIKYSQVDQEVYFYIDGLLQGNRTTTTPMQFRELRLFVNRQGTKYQAVEVKQVAIVTSSTTAEDEEDISDYLGCRWNVGL